MKKCCYCRSEMDGGANSNGFSAPSSSKHASGGDLRCAKCIKNEAKYGKPGVCTYCQLKAAFLLGKCVHCSYFERKFGTPSVCTNCKLKAAFSKQDAQKDKQLLCRLCQITYKRSVNKATSKQKRPSSKIDDDASSKDAIATKQFKSSSLLFDNSSADASSEQMLLIQQLKDEIAQLQKRIVQKDALALERNKKIASLSAETIRLEKDARAKIMQLEKALQTNLETFHEKMRLLNKQLAQQTRVKKNSPLIV